MSCMHQLIVIHLMYSRISPLSLRDIQEIWYYRILVTQFVDEYIAQFLTLTSNKFVFGN